MKKINFNKIIKKLSKSKFFNTEFNFQEICLVMIMTLVIGFTVGNIVFTNIEVEDEENIAVSSDSLSDELSNVEKVYNLITDTYYGEVSKEEIIDGAVNGMMEAVGDDYSLYYDKEENDQFELLLNGSFVGMGAQIGRDTDGNVVFTNVFEGSPVAKAGVETGDFLIEVNGELVDDFTIEEIVSKIKGEVKEVNLVIEVDGEQVEKKFETALVQIPSVSSKTIESNGNITGYIFISLFAENTDEQFKTELEAMEKAGIDNLIIDVRNNSGGHLSSTKNIADFFLNEKQVIYQIESKTGITKTYATSSEERDIEIVVLVNGNSASGSEVLAAALQEEYGSLLVGEKTYGKGSVQKLYDLDNGGAVKLTAELWLTPNGNSIQDIGIEVDYEVKLNDNYYETRDDTDDNQLQKALEILNK